MTVIDSQHLEPYVNAFKALSDPVRVQLFARIATSTGEMSCTDLVNEAHVGPSTVSYHVKILKSAGLVQVRKEGRNFYYTPDWDNCEQHIPGFLSNIEVGHP